MENSSLSIRWESGGEEPKSPAQQVCFSTNIYSGQKTETLYANRGAIAINSDRLYVQ